MRARKKRYIVIVVGVVFVLLVGLLVNNLILAQPSGEYDPWIDTNDDGIIDLNDLQTLAQAYGTSGSPINKTELLLDLQDRVDSLNTTLLQLQEGASQVKKIRFYEPSETTTTSPTTWEDAAIFVWTPNNSTNNAILSISVYNQFWCEPSHVCKD